ncbi:MAG: GMC family oxidoreductase [Solirubrobacterales bacterium]|nr:GMC family oxidoreductase [Solirubrobacterales bacterium]
MAGFDYDVVIIGSGFAGSVAALRAAEKGYRVGVMESGRRWADEDIPKTQWDLAHFVWFPGAELYGVQRIEYLDDVLILCGAGVGGGSHVYASTMYVPPNQFFEAKEWGVSRIGPMSWRRISTRPGGCLASSATPTCRRTSTGRSSRSRTRSAGARLTTRPRSACTSARRGSRPKIRTSAGSGRGGRAASPAELQQRLRP